MKAPKLYEIVWVRMSGIGPQSTIERWEEDDGLSGWGWAYGGVREVDVLESFKNRPHLGITVAGTVHPSKKCRYPGHKI
jgi:hypothetical protein